MHKITSFKMSLKNRESSIFLAKKLSKFLKSPDRKDQGISGRRRHNEQNSSTGSKYIIFIQGWFVCIYYNNFLTKRMDEVCGYMH